jgi:hypothetical protein
MPRVARVGATQLMLLVDGAIAAVLVRGDPRWLARQRRRRVFCSSPQGVPQAQATHPSVITSAIDVVDGSSTGA